MHTYDFALYVWKYDGIERSPSTRVDDSNRGSDRPVISVDADNFEHAVCLAHEVLRGVMLDERVWRCGIIDARRVK